MKTKLLGLMAVISLLGFSPASANTYTYNFSGASFDYPPTETITGSFVEDTTLNKEDSANLTVFGTSFTESGAATCGLGAGTCITAYDVSNDEIEIFFASVLNGSSPDALSGVVYFPNLGSTCSSNCTTVSANPVIVYTFEEVDSASGNAVLATPLPAALPLFATGLGALSFFGWRRKRKNATAPVAA
jgi:hypothetical protein